jgi:hypothetical protein
MQWFFATTEGWGTNNTFVVLETMGLHTLKKNLDFLSRKSLD